MTGESGIGPTRDSSSEDPFDPSTERGLLNLMGRLNYLGCQLQDRGTKMSMNEYLSTREEALALLDKLAPVIEDRELDVKMLQDGQLEPFIHPNDV